MFVPRASVPMNWYTAPGSPIATSDAARTLSPKVRSWLPDLLEYWYSRSSVPTRLLRMPAPRSFEAEVEDASRVVASISAPSTASTETVPNASTASPTAASALSMYAFARLLTRLLARMPV
ncbi:MAG: hypothetical protein AMS20_13930 [Gemmatimonas sp. SG8_28]|nr:MAG: hypothetical protein AMS20_13930 [Gemmatimonas sp. SG8_28]